MTKPSQDLVHASHVRLAYRAMLGREASPEEVKVQLAGLRTTGELLTILAASTEYTGTSRTLLDATPTPNIVNTWHPDFAAWGHQPGALSGDGVAIVGHEGWLFINGGSNSNVAQHTGELQMTDEWATAWAELMRVRLEEADRLGFTTAFVVVPDKLAVQEEHFPEPLATNGPRPVERLIDELGLPLVYPLERLRDARAGGEVYLRTDSHYSLRGNFVVHAAVAEALGVEPLPESTIDGFQAYTAPGDLGGRFDPKVIEVMTSMMTFGDAVVTEDNRPQVAATGGHIGSRRVFRNETARDARTAVLFGDSYGFADPGYEGLVWFLAQLFREVHFVWTPFGWDAGYATRHGAEVVISQTAERFLGRVPAQHIDADDLVRQAESRGGAINPDVVFDATT